MPSPDPADLLAAYDAQLRDEAEAQRALRVTRDGPLVRAEYPGRGFVSYRSLDGFTGRRLDGLIARTIAYFCTATEVSGFEWKTRGHDAPAELPALLIARGFEAEDPETVMVGDAVLLAADRSAPDGVQVRRIDPTAEPGEIRADLARMHALQASVFGGLPHDDTDELAVALVDDPDNVQVWLAEADGEVIGTGRIERVPGTEFAGLWGGAVREDWRGRGVYRALTSARARAAISSGARYLNSDCTEFSRPILERSGLVAITTTTPYVWHRVC